MSFFASYPAALNDVQRYTNLAAFPSAVTAGNGALAIALDTDFLYISNGAAWVLLASGAVGTVTSVAMSVPAFLSVAGSPITSSGTLAVTLSGTALPAANGGTGVTSLASLTEATSSVLTITGGTGSVINATSIQVKLAGAAQSGYLSSTDWNTFNNKQGSGSYITALTGDVTASGPGSVAATLAATSNATLVTLSALTTAGSLATVGTVTSGTWSATTIAVNKGGTGQTTAAAAFNALSPITTTGDTIYSSSGTTNSRLAIGATGNVLTVAGGVPTWAAPATAGTVTSVAMTVPTFLSIAGSPITSSGTLAVTLSGTALPVANGGTGLTSGTSGGVLAYTASGTLASSGALTASQLVIGGGAGVVPSSLAAGSQYQVLVMGATTPGYGQVNLAQSAAITGTLPVANGGTGVTSSTGSTNNVLSNSPVLVTPTLGAALATSVNFGGTSLSTYIEGTFTATLTGCTTSPTATVTYVVVGKMVVLSVPSGFTGTSNTTACTWTGLPAACQPTGQRRVIQDITDNGNAAVSLWEFNSASGTVTMYATVSGGSFTNSGTKGIGQGGTVAYPL